MNKNGMLPLVIMLAAMIGAWVLTGKARRSSEYDEMQLRIRAAGYRLGFFTALILLAAWILLSELNLAASVTPGFAAFAVLLASVVSFAVYCILHGAFLAVRGKAGAYIAIFSVVTLVEGISSVRILTRGKMLENGSLSFGSGSPVLLCLGFAVILAALVVKTVRSGKEAQE